MTSSANIIDFFVHDILDYTILTNDDKNFTKDLSVFDIREAVNQILVIIEDKAIMKNISMKTKYRGFRKKFNIKTDQKRLQQVLLNLLSNAIKFTDRQGEVVITVTRSSDLLNEITINVEDTGIGIREEDQCKLFKLFGFV